jgi:hypothetical protein
MRRGRLPKTVIVVNKKLIISLLIVLLLVIGIFIAVFLSQQNQDIQQHASTDASLVATVDNAPVTEQDVTTATREQYNDKAINKETLSDTLDTVLENKLIASEAKKKGITVSDQEVAERAKTLGGSASGQASIRNQARAEILKEKVSQVVTKTRQVESVGFWLPPANYGAPLTASEAQTVASQKAQKTAVLTEIKQKFDANEDPLAIAQEIQKKYPLFTPIIAVNGYVVSKTPDTTVMTQPKLYTYQDAFKTNTFLSQIFTMNNGEVNIVLTDANAGGVVVKIIDSSDGSYATFDDWLAKNKSSRTKILKQP